MSSEEKLKRAIMDLKNGVEELSERSSFDFGRTVRTSVNEEDGSYYLYGLSEDGTTKYQLSYGTQDTIQSYVQDLRDNVELLDFRGELRQKSRSIIFERKNRNKICVSMKYEITRNIQEPFVGFEHELNSKIPEDSKYVSPVNLSVDSYGLSPMGYDATLVYETQRPQNIYANVQSVEEYAKMKAENSEDSVEDILNQDTYTSHCHPNDSEMLESVESRVWDLIQFEVEKSDDFEVDPAEFSIDESSVEMSVAVTSSHIL